MEYFHTVVRLTTPHGKDHQGVYTFKPESKLIQYSEMLKYYGQVSFNLCNDDLA